MTHAIIHLQNYLHTLENNEPINRAECNTAQADLEREAAIDTRQALKVLIAASNRSMFTEKTGQASQD